MLLQPESTKHILRIRVGENCSPWSHWEAGPVNRLYPQLWLFKFDSGFYQIQLKIQSDPCFPNTPATGSDPHCFWTFSSRQFGTGDYQLLGITGKWRGSIEKGWENDLLVPPKFCWTPWIALQFQLCGKFSLPIHPWENSRFLEVKIHLASRQCIPFEPVSIDRKIITIPHQHPPTNIIHSSWTSNSTTSTHHHHQTPSISTSIHQPPYIWIWLYRHFYI